MPCKAVFIYCLPFCLLFYFSVRKSFSPVNGGLKGMFMEEKKKNRFFFRAVDRPDAQDEDTTPTLKYFFKLFWRKLGKLITLNMMMLFQVLPLIAAVLIYFFGETTPTVSDPLFAPVFGAYVVDASPVSALLLGIFGNQINVPFLTTGKIIAIAALILFTAVTWGWQNIGASYNLRSLVRGDSCFLFSDYFYAIRRNLKQGFWFGLLDFLILAVLAVDFFYFRNYVSTLFSGFLYILIIALIVIYTLMRFYLYLMLITFDLSTRKLLKNALIFSALGIKRNVMALLGIALMVGLNLLIIVPCLSVGFSVPLILPLFYFLSFAGFIAAYAAYPNIKRYMIDPAAPPAESGSETGGNSETSAKTVGDTTPPTAD